MNEIEKYLAKSIHPVGKGEGEEQDVINLNTDIAPAPDDVFCINVMHASDDILPKDVDPNQRYEQQAAVPHKEPCLGIIIG